MSHKYALRRASIVLLGFLLLQWCSFTLAVLIENPPNYDWGPAWLTGMTAVPPTLLAIWLVFGSWPLIHRVPLTLLGVLATGTLAFGGWYLIEPPIPVWALLVLVGSAAVQWTLVQIPLWIARLGFGWRLGVPEPEPPEGSSGGDSSGEEPVPPKAMSPEDSQQRAKTNSQQAELQFGIRHLLIWMGVTALLLGGLRFLLSGEDLRFLGIRVREPALAFSVFAVFQTLIALPCLVLCFGAGRWWTVLFGWLPLFAGYTATFTWIEWQLLAQMSVGFNGGWFVMVNPINAVLTFVSLLILRTAGLRLHQKPAAGGPSG